MQRTTRVLSVAIQAFLIAVATPALTRLDLDVLQRLLEPRRVRRKQSTVDSRDIGAEYATIVDAVVQRARPIVRPGCLTRGITLYALLRRAGVDVALRFGISTSPNGGVEGHCWLTLGEQPFLERSDPRLTFTGIATVSSAGVG